LEAVMKKYREMSLGANTPSSAAAAAAAAAVKPSVRFPASARGPPRSTASDDDDDDDDDDEDVDIEAFGFDSDDGGDGDEPEDIQDADVEHSLEVAAQDQFFQAACKFLLEQSEKMMQRFNQDEDDAPVVHPTRVTQHGVATFVYQYLWLPAKGDYQDEADPKKWLSQFK